MLEVNVHPCIGECCRGYCNIISSNRVCFAYDNVSPSFDGDSRERLNGRLRGRKRSDRY